jgi:hypothetical protein
MKKVVTPSRAAQWCLSARHLPGERAACVPCGADGSIDVPVSEQAGTENRVAVEDSRDRADPVRYGYRKIRVLLNREG